MYIFIYVGTLTYYHFYWNEYSESYLSTTLEEGVLLLFCVIMIIIDRNEEGGVAMSTPVVIKEQIKNSLDIWYQFMLNQDFVQSKILKEEIESKISHIEEDQKILFYYSLLDFRYKVLSDSMNISHDEFAKIDSIVSLRL